MFHLYFFHCFSKDIYFSFKLNTGDGVINSIDELLKNIKTNDVIYLKDETISQKNASDLMYIIGKALYNQVSIIGQPTTIINTNYDDYNAYLLSGENIRLHIENLRFTGFNRPFINMLNSNLTLVNVSFDFWNVREYSFLKFENSVIDLENVLINSSNFTDCNFLTGENIVLNSNHFDILNLSQMVSSDVPFFKLKSSELDFYSSKFKKIDLNESVAFIEATYGSNINFRESNFTKGSMYNIFSIYNDTRVTISMAKIKSNFAQIISAENQSFASVSDTRITRLVSNIDLFRFVDSDIELFNTFITNSTLRSVIKQKGRNTNMSVNYVNASHLNTTGPVFSNNGGNIYIKNSGVKRIISTDSTFGVYHSSGGEAMIESTKFSRIQSSGSGYIFHLSRTQKLVFNDVKISRNNGCAVFSSRNKFSVANSNFTLNTCTRKINDSLIYIANSPQMNVSGTVFLHNNASHGSILLHDSTMFINNTAFRNNSAKFGTALNVFRSDIGINNTKFKVNIAEYYGAGLLMKESSVSIEGTKFKYNKAPKGPSIYSMHDNKVTLRRVSFLMNKGSGELLYSENDIISSLINISVDSPKNVAIVAPNIERHYIQDSLFNGKYLTTRKEFPHMFVFIPTFLSIIIVIFRKKNRKNRISLPARLPL